MDEEELMDEEEPLDEEQLILIKFDHFHASNRYNDGFDSQISQMGYTWESSTGGYFNSDDCEPVWHESKGVPIWREYTIRAFLDSGVAQEYLKLVGLDTFLETSGLRFYEQEYDLKNLRLELP